MNEWNTINEQIQRSKIQRFNWKNIFGKSLSKWCAEQRAKGLSKDEALKIAKQEVMFNIKNVKNLAWLFKNLEIGISARYGEMNSEIKEYVIEKSRSAEGYSILRKNENGFFVYISKNIVSALGLSAGTKIKIKVEV